MQSSDILAQDVELNVDNRTNANIAEVGVLESVGDDGNLEGVCCRVTNRETNSVDSYTTLVDSEVTLQCHLSVFGIFECEVC